MRLWQVFFFVLGSINVFAQTAADRLTSIKTKDQIVQFIKKNASVNPEVVDVYCGADTSILAVTVKDKKPGDVFFLDGYTYKYLHDTTGKFFRVKYIYLDGSVLSTRKIDSIRYVILNGINSGESFSAFHSQYNMDGYNGEGDTGWFDEETMVKPFQNEIVLHRKGEVFIVDVPEKNWYYVVNKTHDDSFLKRCILIRIKGK